VFILQERELISPVCNLGKVASFKHEELDKDWFKQKLKATRFWGLAQTGYSFLDPGLLATFVERWNGDTSTFHLPCGELTVTLDDM
jgi:cobalamin biosynthesis protein CobD/CbiB